MFANKNSEEYCNNGISMTKFGQLIPNFSGLKPVLVNSIFFFFLQKVSVWSIHYTRGVNERHNGTWNMKISLDV